eukprot:2461100-Rhodomonas_salina.3
MAQLDHTGIAPYARSVPDMACGARREIAPHLKEDVVGEYDKNVPDIVRDLVASYAISALAIAVPSTLRDRSTAVPSAIHYRSTAVPHTVRDRSTAVPGRKWTSTLPQPLVAPHASSVLHIS